MAQRARTVLNKSPSLTSILTNTSIKTNATDMVYWVELCIERGKDLSIKDFNGTSDPYVKVYYGTEEKYVTNTVYKNLNPIWNEKLSFFVHDLNIPISFCLFDYDRIGRDESMGSAKIDLWKLPLEKNYLFQNKFFILLEFFFNITINKTNIRFYQARDLSAKDINGKSDPFCVVELDSTRLRTHTIYKTLDPVWNKSFIIPVQDIHSVLELTIFDEDTNKSTEFIGKIAIPLLAIQNGEKKWMTLKDRKCILPVKGIIEIEATLIYTNLRAIIRTFNPRQVRYYQQDGKFRVGVFKQHINRVRNMLKCVVNAAKFVNYCFEWENPILSFCSFN
ncbi:unnamed protein product, partial [Rotaria sp. Silwood2]